MNFKNFLNENKLNDYDVIKIKKNTSFDKIKKLTKYLRDNNYRYGPDEHSLVEYVKLNDIGIYLDNKNKFLSFDIWEDVINRYDMIKFKVITIEDVIGKYSKYVKQIKWE